jgi:gamma-glutamyltranspeptidase/glutathione hydrolase
MDGIIHSMGYPYPSQRMPVMGSNIVATSQPLASQAGLRMLLRGGNAVDAAIAAAITLTVVEPTSNGVGSDAFALVWDEEEGALHGLNASGRSPAAWAYDHFAQYIDEGTMPRLGWDAVTVPGAVSAWFELSERFGDLPFEVLFIPAIRCAREGFPVSPITARVWGLAHDRYQGMEEFAEVFLPGGRAPRAGEVFRNPHLARTLESIAGTGGEAFYRGGIAETIADHAATTGGLLSREDLASHSPDWVEPISIDYHGLALHEIPPNGQGMAALQTLGILGNLEGELDVRSHAPDSVQGIHLQAEAMKLAFADTHRYVSDPETMERDAGVDALLDPDYLKARSGLIDPRRAQDPGYGTPGPGGTVYLTTADENGMMVSFIQSNYMGFGSGIVVPGTGIALQNRGTGFSLERGHPNQVDGGKRPFHTIIPAFVTQDSSSSSPSEGDDAGHRTAVMSFGVMGGPMQPQGHAQLMVRIFDHGQGPQAAIDAPRWQVFPDGELALEPGFPDEVVIGLSKLGHRVTAHRECWWFGGAQAIMRLPGETVGGGKGTVRDRGRGGNVHYTSGSDPRKDGQAVGY